MKYSISITASAQTDLDDLPGDIRRQITRKIDYLAANPRPSSAQPLQGAAYKGLWKLPSGDYRIVYKIEHGRLVILIVAVGNRKDIYERLGRRLRG